MSAEARTSQVFTEAYLSQPVKYDRVLSLYTHSVKTPADPLQERRLPLGGGGVDGGGGYFISGSAVEFRLLTREQYSSVCVVERLLPGSREGEELVDTCR